MHSLSNTHRHATIAEACIEKKHYHVGKKVVHVGSVWHPDTLFQPNDILVGTSFSCRKYR